MILAALAAFLTPVYRRVTASYARAAAGAAGAASVQGNGALSRTAAGRPAAVPLRAARLRRLDDSQLARFGETGELHLRSLNDGQRAGFGDTGKLHLRGFGGGYRGLLRGAHAKKRYG